MTEYGAQGFLKQFMWPDTLYSLYSICVTLNKLKYSHKWWTTILLQYWIGLKLDAFVGKKYRRGYQIIPNYFSLELSGNQIWYLVQTFHFHAMSARF